MTPNPAPNPADFLDFHAVMLEHAGFGRCATLQRWRAWLKDRLDEASLRGDSALRTQCETVLRALDDAEAMIVSMRT